MDIAEWIIAEEHQAKQKNICNKRTTNIDTTRAFCKKPRKVNRIESRKIRNNNENTSPNIRNPKCVDLTWIPDQGKPKQAIIQDSAATREQDAEEGTIVPDELDEVPSRLIPRYIKQELLRSGELLRDTVVNYTVHVLRRNASRRSYISNTFFCNKIIEPIEDPWSASA